MATYIALLRGINVAGHNKVPMARLRKAAEDAGLEDVRTYIQSGNVLFASAARPAVLEPLFESSIRDAFGLEVPVVVRSATMWKKYATSCPFPGAATERPSLVHLCLSKTKPTKASADAVAAKGQGGERAVVQGDALWVDYPSGAGRSKITPAVLDRSVGAPVTARNWRTVQRLAEMMDG